MWKLHRNDRVKKYFKYNIKQQDVYCGGFFGHFILNRLCANRNDAKRRRLSHLIYTCDSVSSRPRLSTRSEQQQTIAQPTSTPSILRLAKQNAHSRDARIAFFETDHYYTLDGAIRFPMSVSNVWALFFKKFDANEKIEELFCKWTSNQNSRYYMQIATGRLSGLSDEKIKLQIASSWAEIGAEARAKGTYLHRQIELFLNGLDCDDSIPEMYQFKQFLEEFAGARGLIPYRTEWSIYDDRHMVAGQIDCIFKDEIAGTFHMVDWKRTIKELSPNEGSSYNEFGKFPCHNFINNTYNHYVAQQNLYAAILADCYDIELSSMSLVQLHEERLEYRVICVPKILDVARSMLHLASPHQLSTSLSSSDVRPSEAVDMSPRAVNKDENQ